MYPPPHHQEPDKQKIIAVIKQFPLAMLVSAKDAVPFVTHIPIIYNEASGNLVAHIDAHNPQLETLKNGVEVTVVFRGPDCYISPSIYTTPQLPTWNYIITHIKGTIKLIDDPKIAKKTMVNMTTFLEGPEQKFKLKMDDPRMERLINYIKAFEIIPSHWEGKFKLSQDKNKEDFEAAKNQMIKISRKEIKDFIEKLI